MSATAIERIRQQWPTICTGYLSGDRVSFPLSTQRHTLRVFARSFCEGRAIAGCPGLLDRATAAAGMPIRRIHIVLTEAEERAETSRRDCPVQRSELRGAITRLPLRALKDSAHPAASKIRRAAALLNAALAQLDVERTGED